MLKFEAIPRVPFKPPVYKFCIILKLLSFFLLLCVTQSRASCSYNQADTSNTAWQKTCGADLCGGGLPPPREESTVEKAALIYQSILEAASGAPFPIGTFASVGAGVINFGLGDDNPSSQWNQGQLQNALNVVQDYIVCKMAQLQRETITKIENMFSSKLLSDFNDAMNGFQTAVNEQCGVWNCLAEVNTAPSQRSGSCAVLSENTLPGQCRNVSAFDPQNPVLCITDDLDRTGFCDKGACYATIHWGNAARKVNEILTGFVNSPAVKNFQVFNSYQSDPTATVALAKGSLVKLILLQQLYMLGEPGSGEQLRTYINMMANQLQGRVDRHLNALKQVAEQLSYGNSTHLAIDCGNPESSFGNSFIEADFYPSPYGEGVTMYYIQYTQGPKDNPATLRDQSYVRSRQVVRPSCDASTFVETASLPLSDNVNIACGLGKLSNCGVSSNDREKAWKSCFSTTASPKLGQNEACNAQMLSGQQQNMASAVTKVQSSLKEVLAPVLDIIASYKKMAAIGGMAPAFENVFKSQGYPKQQCVLLAVPTSGNATVPTIAPTFNPSPMPAGSNAKGAGKMTFVSVLFLVGCIWGI